MIGLLGAHRTGKTTLAEAFAKEQKLPFLRTSVSASYRLIGADPALEYPLDKRLAIQAVVLEHLGALYEQQAFDSPLFVTDRTPLDLAAYMLADVARTSCDSTELDDEIVNYVDRCFDLANRFFRLIVLVQPGIPWVEAEGKAPRGRSYQEHINALALGLLIDSRFKGRGLQLPREVIDLDKRKRSLAFGMVGTLQRFKPLMEVSREVVH